MRRVALAERKLPDYTKGEEWANALSHAAGALISVFVLVLCILTALRQENLFGVIGGAVYGLSMLLLFLFSSVYHALSPCGMTKRVFQILDHCAIFLLIAGSYTPICLCVLREVDSLMAWGILGAVWTAAFAGIVLNAIDLNAFYKVSAVCYLAMGWCIVFAWKALPALLERGGFFLLGLGGLCYTVGAVFYYRWNKTRYMHFVFHMFVLIGAVLHAVYILWYVV